MIHRTLMFTLLLASASAVATADDMKKDAMGDGMMDEPAMQDDGAMKGEDTKKDDRMKDDTVSSDTMMDDHEESMKAGHMDKDTMDDH